MGFKVRRAVTRAIARVTVVAYRGSDGRFAGTFLGSPVLLLDHVGRRTGQRRRTPLHYIRRGDDFVVVGSWAGADIDPDWRLNLRVRPEVSIQVAGRHVAVTAHEAQGCVRDELWSELVRTVPAFDVYQRRTSRRLPVIVLSPDQTSTPVAEARLNLVGSVRGWVAHAGALASPIALTALNAAREESQTLRLQRLGAASRDRREQRCHPARAKMRALSVSPGGRFTWQSVAAPLPPGPMSAIVRPLAVATCDLDRPLALGRTPFPLPLHFGHECVAEVVAVGEQVATVSAGDRVIVPFQISCGTCDRCAAGLTANCHSVPPISMYGFGVGGGHWGGVLSDKIEVPYADGMLVALPRDLDPATAASVADNISDAYRHVGPYLPALQARQDRPTVIIVGPTDRRSRLGGSVPVYTALIARALGADEVSVVDARANVRTLAERLGLTAVPHHHRRDLGLAPLVVDTSGTPAGLRAALTLTARDGICSSVGGLHASGRLPIGQMYARNITLHITRAHARTIIPSVLDLMSSDRLHPELVTTTVAELDDAPTILRDHVAGDAIKTILTTT
jgi:alcohol dehydrogenase